MLKLQGTLLKYEPFTSKKNKELVSLTVFGEDKEVYQALAQFKDVAKRGEGEKISFSIGVSVFNNKLSLFVNEDLTDNEKNNTVSKIS